MVSQQIKIGLFAVTGIFSILLGAATIYVYQTDPVDIIKYRFQNENIPLGEYPHDSECIRYPGYVYTMSSLFMIMGIIALRFIKYIYNGESSDVYSGCLFFICILLSIVHIVVLLIIAFTNAYPESDTSLGEAITSENFILYRTKGCSQYLLDHHMASFISLFVLLSIPACIIFFLFLHDVVIYFICCKECPKEEQF